MTFQDPDKILEQIHKDKEKKSRKANDFRLLRQKQCLSLSDLSVSLNVSEEDLAIFEKRGECSDDVFERVIDWMLDVLDKMSDV